METRTLFIILVVAAGLALFLGYESGSRLEITAPDTLGTAQAIPGLNNSGSAAEAAGQGAVTAIELRLPAVDRDGNGLLADLTVEKSPGTGGFYLRLNKDSPLTNPDTQASIKTAFEVARTLAKTDSNDANLYYSFNTDSDIVGGKSAGAAMTMASIALLRGESLRPDTLITGTIEPDGRIGKVGKVMIKAMAVKHYGFKTLIVPKGESVELQEVQDCTTSVVDGAVYHTCQTSTITVDLEKETGLEIVEVETAKQAYELMKAA